MDNPTFSKNLNEIDRIVALTKQYIIMIFILFVNIEEL